MTKSYQTSNPQAKDARERLLGGENCAMAIFAAFSDDPRTPGINAAAAYGIGHGVAGCQALCGAMNAAAQVISIAVGTEGLTPKAAQKRANKLIRPLMLKFEKQFGSVDCKHILEAKPLTIRRTPFCADLVAWTVDAVEDVLREM